MRDPILATARINGRDYGRKVPGVMHVKGGLHYIKGNSAPYFSLTADVHRQGFPNQYWSGGAMHDEILKRFPRFSDLAALHLCDIDGAPMHAAANGLYWIAGALGGLGRRYHGGNSTPAKSPTECRAVAMRHFRCTESELDSLIVALSKAEPDAHESAVAAFADGLRDRWKAEALACIERHGLRLFGDVDAWRDKLERDGTAARFAETLARLDRVTAPASRVPS
jgi:hypothetical protein